MAVVLLVLPLLFPQGKRSALRPLTDQEMQLLKPKLFRYTAVSTLILLPLLIGSVWFVGDFLIRVFKVLPGPLQTLSHPFIFPDIYLIFPSIGFGSTLTLMVTSDILRLIYREKAELYSHAYSQQHGYDNKAALKGFQWFTGIAGLICLLAVYNWYAGVREKGNRD